MHYKNTHPVSARTLVTTLLQATVHISLCFSEYDKTNGQRCRALRDRRAVNSLGTQIKPGV